MQIVTLKTILRSSELKGAVLKYRIHRIIYLLSFVIMFYMTLGIKPNYCNVIVYRIRLTYSLTIACHLRQESSDTLCLLIQQHGKQLHYTSNAGH